MRLAATDIPLDLLLATETLDATIVDDAGFPKQGTESVGVQRQYSGSAGKTTNGQLTVSADGRHAQDVFAARHGPRPA